MVTWLGRMKVKIMIPIIIFLPGNSNLASPYPTMEQDSTFSRVGTPATMILRPSTGQKFILEPAWA
ncbi:hypothetical protein IMSAGC003_03588 [Lachnospiraceae bacterium]|nr:hypothetical protein IMSAGC003_03588 [Lachnospiraceae bacterium]